jgi:ribonuclease HIII
MIKLDLLRELQNSRFFPARARGYFLFSKVISSVEIFGESPYNEEMQKPSCFVTTIDLRLADKLREDLATRGFQFEKPPYTIFSAKKDRLSCTLYSSGKLTVQGKDKDEFIEFYLEPEILGNLSYSHPELGIDFTPHIGIDEAGKGDFFGPLCIAGLYADEEGIRSLLQLGAKDSKALSDDKAHKIAKLIKERFAHAVVTIYPERYNELYANFHNLNRLLAWGHATAIAELVEKTGCKEVLIDRFAEEFVVESAVKKKNLAINLTQRVRGEEDPVVAGASILARAAFLDGLRRTGSPWAIDLPKGAGAPVLTAGKSLVRLHGRAILNQIAKLHFKTTQEILAEAADA